MWHALVWTVMAAMLGSWSLLCWGFYRLLTGPDWQAASGTGWLAWLEQWRIPVWLADWLPMASITALKAALTALGPWLETLLAQAPGLPGWLAPLVWVAWAMGALALLMLGVAGSVLVVALRRPARV